ncbi:juvenile hormone esterase [Culex quinquefasciatus]|uniref:Carboxylic ester hydrolase n=1 Tax=Culex quinquefasciatus TaxID=7176 RepID=B0WAG2_CULQU|nr:juvenile hormone esterase [Culex quinquefasciatus]|eukprot:XP_001845696.1 juvenile hormone esterase [Culex quinquefasciatus]
MLNCTDLACVLHHHHFYAHLHHLKHHLQDDHDHHGHGHHESHDHHDSATSLPLPKLAEHQMALGYGPERLMDTRKVILVVIQYRLGAFGFLSTGDSSSPGNYGLKDQSMALRWVQSNIEMFGGDPTQVTLVGQSAGGAAVQMHMMSRLSRGTFQEGVSMSGTVLAYWNYNVDQARVARRQADVLGIPAAYKLSTKKLVDALRRVDAVELGKSIDQLKYFFVHPTALYQPVPERHSTNESFLDEEPRALWAAGKYQQTPWFTGTVPNDGAADSLGIVTNVTLLNQLNEKSRAFIPRLGGGADVNAMATQMLLWRDWHHLMGLYDPGKSRRVTPRGQVVKSKDAALRVLRYLLADAGRVPACLPANTNNFNNQRGEECSPDPVVAKANLNLGLVMAFSSKRVDFQPFRSGGRVASGHSGPLPRSLQRGLLTSWK